LKNQSYITATNIQAQMKSNNYKIFLMNQNFKSNQILDLNPQLISNKTKVRIRNLKIYDVQIIRTLFTITN